MQASTKVLSTVAIVAAFAAAIAGIALVTPSAPAPVSARPSPVQSTILPGGAYVEPTTEASIAAARLAAEGDGESAALIREISSQPTAIWLGEWFTGEKLTSFLDSHVAAADAAGTTLVFVTYGIPNRDCGGYSAGGHSYDDYLDWNRSIATSLAGSDAVVLVEPDSLSLLSSAKCDGEAGRRLPLIREAVKELADAGLVTYLDGGGSRWLTPEVQAGWLEQAGIGDAHGFFTNVSNFNTTQDERDYAGKVSSRVGWKHFVIDVSRNGAGWTGTWCNPEGAALGPDPSVTTDGSLLDALLWVKHPGASDGTCNGGPEAGDWWESYALDLVRDRSAARG